MENKKTEEQVSELFDNWNGLKQELHFDKAHVSYYHEREIWWVAMGQNIGTEVYGKGDDHLRPVLVIKKFGKSFIGVPLTSQEKSFENKFFFELPNVGMKNSWAMLTQVRLFDAKRLFHIVKEVNKIPSHVFDELKKAIVDLCF